MKTLKEVELFGGPRRTRTCNPLMIPETLCSWFVLQFPVSCIIVLGGVWRGFVPKLVL